MPPQGAPRVTLMSNNDLPVTVTSYKPQILKIKIGHFRAWIEKRLTDLLDGMEDEILWSLVFNYLEDAQKRAKREGPAANPSGGLNAKDIQTALSGFLGAKSSRDFTAELFTLLAKAEESETGIPPEFNMNPQEAENEAFGIIQSKRKEMELSDRVRREIRRTDHHNHPRDRTDHQRRHRSPPSRSRSREDRHRRSYSPEQSSHGRHRDRYEDDRHYRRYRDDSREARHRDDYDRRHENDDYDRRHHDDHGRRRDDHYRPRKDRSDSLNRNNRHDRRRHSSKSPIPSSSPGSPSPCWEATLDIAKPAAPTVHENVSNELEMALKARALKALIDKRD